MVNRALCDALSAFHPSRLETSLLGTILLPKHEARASWEAFAPEAGDLKQLFRADRGRLKRLGPIIGSALRRIEAPVNPGLLTVLRTAHLREQLRADAYTDIMKEALSALRGNGIPFLLLSGAALAQTTYREAALRHAHDIDILVKPTDQPRAVQALESADFLPVATTPRSVSGCRSVHHRTTLPVNVHTRLLQPPLSTPSWEALWETRVAIGDPEESSGLSPENTLLLTLGRAATSRTRASLQWVLDAAHVIERHPTLRWDSFLAEVTQVAMLLPAWTMLWYLATELGVKVPSESLARLETAAPTVDVQERDAVLYIARRGLVGGASQLVRRGSTLAARIAIFRWLAFPSPAYIRRSYGVKGTLGLPVAYLRRLVT